MMIIMMMMMMMMRMMMMMTKNIKGHNSANYSTRTSRFYMVEDLNNTYR